MAKKSNEIKLSVSNLAQIREGSVSFGDFTLIVGAQASGKSLFLQMLKLIVDRHQIYETLELHAYDWGGKFENLLNMYFGESMSGIWKSDTSVTWEGKNYNSKAILARQGAKASKEESMFYIPAQRVVTMSQGFPRPFSSFEVGDPYVLKSFSETMRVLMEKESANNGQENIFPKTGKMSKAIREQLDSGIFHGASIELDKSSGRKRFLLRIGESRLPFMTWSAGQKEFMPLLLSLYHLIPSGNIPKKENIDWVVIEEPEMGLHPKAIQTVMLLALQLIQRGYKVVISTHSPVLLELVWVINNLKQYKASGDELFDLFNIPKNPEVRKIFQTSIVEKTFNTWYFQREKDGVYIRDISALDAGSDNPDMANWGGLSEFASRAVDIISKLAAHAEK
ncbi:MAG: ATP-binding protein [Saprospiraceae bacterium]|nr:ATP-binding protein [Saprospiraceae bacterium]